MNSIFLYFLYFILLSFNISFTPKLYAQGKKALDSQRSFRSTSTSRLKQENQSINSTSNLQAIVPGSLESMRRQIFNELAKSESNQLSWPPFPRMWMERTIQEVKSSNTYLGWKPSFFLLTGGTKINIQFKYATKTSFILVSSRKANDSKSLDDSLSAQLVSSEDHLREVLVWNEETRMNYPNVLPNQPMVGLCAFESSLAIEKGKQLNFDILGSGQALDSSKIETISQSAFSNFFQLNKDISIQSYLDHVCADIFKSEVEESLVADFSRQVIEKLVQSNPSSECRPNPKQSQIESKGDIDCNDWFKSQISPMLQKITVPRCELNKQGSYKCVLKSKENSSCPLYWSKAEQSFSSIRSEHHRIKATNSIFEYPCDIQNGLSCKLKNSPWFFLGTPFINEAKAACEKN